MSLVMNGINPDAKRHPDDFYVTEPRAVIELMEALESLEIELPPLVVDSSVGPPSQSTPKTASFRKPEALSSVASSPSFQTLHPQEVCVVFLA